MQLDLDQIKFESRNEIESIMDALDHSTDRDSEDVKRLRVLLDVMHMAW